MSFRLPRDSRRHPAFDRFTMLPQLLFERQADLGLTDAEFRLLGNLLAFDWGSGSIIPRVRVLAGRMGWSERKVQRTRAALVGRGLLAVEARYRSDNGQTSNRYSLGPLLAALLSSASDEAVTGPTPVADTPPVTAAAGRETETPEPETETQTVLPDRPGPRSPLRASCPLARWHAAASVFCGCKTTWEAPPTPPGA